MLELLIDNEILLYKIEYKRIKKIYIRFKNDHFLISAPLLTSRKQIEKILTESKNSLERLKRRKPKINLDLSLDANLRLIGQDYLIKHGLKEMIIGNTIYLKSDELKKSLNRITSKLLENYVRNRIKYFYDLMYQDSNYPSLIIKDVRSKLGHYHLAKHQIMIGLGMVYNNSDLIDYVIVHELAHIQEFNHQSNFYKLISKIMPNYKALEKSLKTQGEVV
jgi:predicted metal-dependent hydrolase